MITGIGNSYGRRTVTSAKETVPELVFLIGVISTKAFPLDM